MKERGARREARGCGRGWGRKGGAWVKGARDGRGVDGAVDGRKGVRDGRRVGVDGAGSETGGA